MSVVGPLQVWSHLGHERGRADGAGADVPVGARVRVRFSRALYLVYHFKYSLYHQNCTGDQRTHLSELLQVSSVWPDTAAGAIQFIHPGVRQSSLGPVCADATHGPELLPDRVQL